MAKNYFICTVQRSGKSWLCGLLRGLNYGAPEEYLMHFIQREKSEKLMDIGCEELYSQVAEYVAHTSDTRDTGKIPLGLAIQSVQIKNLAKLSGTSEVAVFNGLAKVFNDPEYIYLFREDIAAQAVSHFFMAKTGVGHSYQEKSVIDQTYEHIQYDYQEILKWYTFTKDGYDFWEELFRDAQVQPMRVSYESLLENLDTDLRKILMKIQPSKEVDSSRIASCSKRGLQKISFNKKTEFISRFNAEFPGDY